MSIAAIKMAVLRGMGTLSLPAALEAMKPLAGYAIGIALYSIFIFEFYRFISDKDIFELELTDYARGKDRIKNALKVGLYVLQYLIVFPLFVMLWFTIFSTFITVMAQNVPVQQVMLVTMGVVAAIRVGAYYHRELAHDVAKMLPLALLGAFLIDIRQLTLEETLALLDAVVVEWQTLLYYLAFTMLLELVLRIGTVIRYGTLDTGEQKEEKKKKDGEGAV